MKNALKLVRMAGWLIRPLMIRSVPYCYILSLRDKVVEVPVFHIILDISRTYTLYNSY